MQPGWLSIPCCPFKPCLPLSAQPPSTACPCKGTPRCHVATKGFSVNLVEQAPKEFVAQVAGREKVELCGTSDSLVRHHFLTTHPHPKKGSRSCMAAQPGTPASGCRGGWSKVCRAWGFGEAMKDLLQVPGTILLQPKCRWSLAHWCKPFV